MSLLAPLPPPCWPQNYLARVSGGFRGFAKMVSLAIRVFSGTEKAPAGRFWRLAIKSEGYAARLISSRMDPAAQTNNSAPSVVATAAESSE
jgi:hypothetical protein